LFPELDATNVPLTWLSMAELLIRNASSQILLLYFIVFYCIHCLQCFDAVGWAAGRHPACKKTEW